MKRIATERDNNPTLYGARADVEIRAMKRYYEWEKAQMAEEKERLAEDIAAAKQKAAELRILSTSQGKEER
jgi:hypothetical protein